jgi:hypothetical protein
MTMNAAFAPQLKPRRGARRPRLVERSLQQRILIQRPPQPQADAATYRASDFQAQLGVWTRLPEAPGGDDPRPERDRERERLVDAFGRESDQAADGPHGERNVGPPGPQQMP